jgi:hypothetical protein
MNYRCSQCGAACSGKIFEGSCRDGIDRFCTEPCRTEFLAYKKMLKEKEKIDRPPHYTSHPSGIECITITEHMNFNVGNAIKYLWRAGLKSKNPIEDLEKAKWYVTREIERLRKEGAP